MQVEGGATINAVPLEYRGTVDPPDIAITKGGEKQRKLSISLPKIVEADRSIVAPIEMVVDGPGTVNGFPL